MSVTTNLYLNTRWELDDIKKVIERITGEKVEVTSNHDTSIGFYHFILPKMQRQISVFTDSRTPIGHATSLSLGANEQGHKLLKDIAEVFGGIYIDNDCEGKAEIINGAMDEGDALPYFIKYAIVDDGVDADDINGFLKSMHTWHQRIEANKEPATLQRIIRDIQ